MRSHQATLQRSANCNRATLFFVRSMAFSCKNICAASVFEMTRTRTALGWSITDATTSMYFQTNVVLPLFPSKNRPRLLSDRSRPFHCLFAGIVLPITVERFSLVATGGKGSSYKIPCTTSLRSLSVQKWSLSSVVPASMQCLWQWYVCMLHRGSNCSLARATNGRIMRCGIISSCQSAATSQIVKRSWACGAALYPVPDLYLYLFTFVSVFYL